MLDDAGKNVGQFWISKDTYGINLITDHCSLAEENKFFLFYLFYFLFFFLWGSFPNETVSEVTKSCHIVFNGTLINPHGTPYFPL